MDKINILYTCDNAYLDLTSISMASVIKNNEDSFITFYIATESNNHPNFERLKQFYKDNKKIEIKYLDCKGYDHILEKNKLDKWGSNSFYVYWKLFAYDQLDVDKIWYLDSDVICMSKIEYPNLKESKAIGAVLDSAHAIYNKVAHIDENYYFFNTGSLFVDVARWKKNNCVEKIVNYLNSMKHKPLMCDQDILAISLQDDIEVLSPKYNYFSGYDYYGVHNSFEMYSLNKKPFYREEEITTIKNQIVFYHCLGGVCGRPWQKGNTSPIKNEFNKYRLLSAWPDYETAMSTGSLFKIEKALEILPKPIYNKFHNLAMIVYYKKMGN